jgi:hypothetical protein
VEDCNRLKTLPFTIGEVVGGTTVNKEQSDVCQSNRDLKQTGRQRDDDGYSHNDIPDLVQKK